MKIISAIPGTPPMNKEEVYKFLESKLLLQIRTIDDEGDPNIHPVWFNHGISKATRLFNQRNQPGLV